MGAFQNYPYADVHQLNLDWIIKKMKEIRDKEDELDQAVSDAQGYAENAHESLLEITDIYDNIKEVIVTPEMFGAVGDGIADDTVAFQSACDAGKYILLRQNAVYLITNTVHLSKGTTIDFNHATIRSTYRHVFFNFYPDDLKVSYAGNGNITLKNGELIGGGISLAHCSNILISDMRFSHIINNHCFELCSCDNVTFRNVSFIGMKNDLTPGEFINIDPCYPDNFPWFTNSGSYDGTPNNNIVVDSCLFSNGSEANFAHASFAFGCHSNGTAGLSNHTNIRFTNNIVEGMVDDCLRIHCMDNVKVNNNVLIYDSSQAIQMGSWVVCTNVSITDNYFLSTKATGSYFAYIYRSAGIDGLVLWGNSYDRRNNSTTVTRKFNWASNTSSTIYNFIKVEPEPFSSLTDITPPLTAYNRIMFFTGTVASGTYRSDVIGSYYARNFRVGESYPLLIGTSTPSYTPVTITDEHTLTTSANVISFYLYKEDTFTTA